MNFHQRNKNFLFNNNQNKNIILSFIAVVFFVVVFSLPWSRNLLFSAGSPLWSIKNTVESFISYNIQILNSKNNLLEENTSLKEQVLIKNKEQILFDILKKENEELKNILNRKKSDQKFLLSSVLVKPFLSAYDTLIIDVGLHNGVNVGDKVIADGSTFIGYIKEVYDTTSKVVLYSSPGEKVSVLIGNNNVAKEAIGLGGGNFKVETPREIDVKEGDSIVIPTISYNVFGVVEKVEFKESDSFQNILFKNPVNISELKWVEVFLPYKK